jgi:putative transposase
VKGRPWDDVAQELGITRAFICKWRSRYKKCGVEGLRLGYKGSKSYLTENQKEEVISWLHEQKHWSVNALHKEIDLRYNVVYKSKQSYYDLLHEARLSWKKNQKRNPKEDPEQVESKRNEIENRVLLERPGIVLKRTLFLFVDECHLLWGDALGYVWGPRSERIEIPILNERERQSYYGALNHLSGEAFTFSAEAGNSEGTVSFLKHLRQRFQGRKLVLAWDGASYHYSDLVKGYLRGLNGDRKEEERLIQCIRFAPNAPRQNPMEDVWLAAKNFVRRHWYKIEAFEQVKEYFTTFIAGMRFQSEKLNWYGRLQLI